MSIIMYDDIYVSALPLGAQAYAGYVGGSWPTYPSLVNKFPHALLLSIAVNASEDAECLDVEQGDATIPEVYAWFKRQLARGVWKPCIYISQGQLAALYATMTANGFTRSSYRIWSAHYGLGAHVCSPSACRAPITADGTQWTALALGRSLDQSLLNDGFFYVAPKPVPTPTPAPKPVEVHDMPNGVIRTPVGVPESRGWDEGTVSTIGLVSVWRGVQASAPVVELTITHANSKPYTATVTLPANGPSVYVIASKADVYGCSFKRVDSGSATVSFYTK